MDLRCRSFHLKEYNPFSIFMDYYIKATNMIAYRLTCENNLRGSEYCFSLGLSISYGISLLYILLTVALPFSGDTLPLNSWMLTIAILISLDLICMCKFIKFTQQETHDWKLVIGSIAFFKLTIIPISLAFVNVLFLIFSRNKSFLNIKPAKGSL